MALVVALTGLFILTAWSFPASNYAKNSRLASGKWVKIEIPGDGVYELTRDELAEMGFNDMRRVAIFGHGGHILSEVLTGTHVDDLKQVPTLLTDNKICFYACGPMDVTLNNPSSSMPYFNRVLNTYANAGYYFVTETDEAPARIRSHVVRATGQSAKYETSLNWFIHEQELNSIGNSGKELLGERLMDQSCDIAYNLPKLAIPQLTVLTRVAALADIESYIDAEIIAGGQTLPLDYSAMKIPSPSIYHYYCTPSTSTVPVTNVALPDVLPQGVVRVNNVMLKSSGTVKNSYLDYVLMTYEQHNSLANEPNHQLNMCFPLIQEGDTILLKDASPNTILWNIDGPSPLNMNRLEQNGNDVIFESSLMTKAAKFIAFEPNESLCHITGYEEIENQNLHGCPTPEFLIFTRKEFAQAAEKLAELHRTVDGMDVLVVTQDQVFNEFSSGTPDAMALRLLCKMFYDRDPNKFKLLLRFGEGTFDNRQLITKKPGALITFETNNSEKSTESYSTDEFYGILGDGTGVAIAKEYINLGVGRITTSSAAEAENDVKKIAKYITEPDYGTWRNNAFIASDKGNDNLHMWQAQVLGDEIEKTYNVKLNQYKAFIPLCPNAVDEPLVAEDKRTSPEATRYMEQALNNGAYYASYVGHAGHSVFTQSSRLWTTSKVNSTSYKHIPIMTTACCDAAPFDQNVRGIAEHMLHKVDGGCIALLTSTRSVFATGNHTLNLAFTKELFNLNNGRSKTTLGEANKQAKLSLLKSSTSIVVENHNKMMFMLLGDPAIKVNYPLNLMRVTKLNGKAVDDDTQVNISSMQYLDIEAEVKAFNSENIDNTFNGDGTVTLFDAERSFGTIKPSSGANAYREIFYPRQQVAQVDAKIVNGKLTARILIPRDLGMATGNMRLSLYAHKTGTDEMVNGIFDNLKVSTTSSGTTVTDNQAPVIESMFFDEEASFIDTKSTTSDGILHITATDETALNIGTGTSGDMKLLLDNGNQSFYLVKDFGTLSNSGKRLDIAMPMSGLQSGYHTLTFTLHDVAGNVTTKSIDFYVDESSSVELAAN
ncbi:MAG: type IX secretion system sortase PorU, partial [Muribaculaceae bacterium]|nr:type IX secretion system sortase PorU [Muribaculaceae bacterium]